MDIQWTYNGHTMDIQWTYNGHTMDIQWTYNGHTMDIQWTYNGNACLISEKILVSDQMRNDTELPLLRAERYAVNRTRWSGANSRGAARGQYGLCV